MASKSKKALMEQVEKLFKTSAIAYIGLAALAILLMGGQSTSLVWEYSTTDNVSVETSNQLGSAEKTLFDFEYRYALAGVLAFSAVLLILLATNYKRQYGKTVKAKISGWRWAYMGLSSAVLLEFVALVFGINNLAILKVIGLVIILTVIFAWIAERETAQSKSPKWFAYIAGLVCGIAAWLPIIGVAKGTWLFGMASFDWYVYAAGAAALLGFAGFAYNQHKVLRGKFSYELGERNYFAIDLASKALVAIVLIIGLAS
jgi:hypothetical protein